MTRQQRMSANYKRRLRVERLETRHLLAGVQSDEFSGTQLDEVWQFVDPLGDGSAAVEDGRLRLAVPAGPSHDIWSTGNDAPRVVQQIDDTDFQFEIKFDTIPTGAYATAGIVIEAGPGTFLRFDFTSNSGGLQVFAASIDGNNAVVRHNKKISSVAPLYMRVGREGDFWRQEYSSDGQAWQTAGEFTDAIDVTALGIIAGNYARSSAPAFNLSVDYIRNTNGLSVTVDSSITNSDSPSLSGLVSDPLATVEVTVTGSSYSAINNGDGTWGLPAGTIAPALGDGSYDIQATASLGSGETANDTTSSELTVDRVAPSVTVGFLSVGTSSPALAGSVNDVGATVSVAVNGSWYTATNFGDGTWSVPAGMIDPALADGIYDVVAEATDVAGNVGVDPTTNELVIDSTIPVITVDPIVTNQTQPLLSGAVNDPAATIEVVIESLIYSAANFGNGRWLLAAGLIEALTEGSYDVIASATSASGTIGVDASLDELQVDLTPPGITLNSLSTSDTTPDLSGFIDDPEAGVQVTLAGEVYQAINLGNGSWQLFGEALLLELAVGVHPVDLESTDSAGNSSLLSSSIEVVGGAPVIDVWYDDVQSFGQIGLTQKWVNILGNVSDLDGIATLVYSLNGGPDQALSIGPDNRRLELPGDFNIDIDEQYLNEGANTVVITATDTQDNQATKTVDLIFTHQNQWPDEYVTDWQTAQSVSDVTQIVDGKWELVPDGVRTTEIGYDRILSFGNVQWTDYEIEVPVTIHSWQDSEEPMVGIITYWNGHGESGTQPNWHWWPLGAIGGYRQTNGTNRIRLYGWATSQSSNIANQAMTLDQGIKYIYKMRVTSNPGSTATYRFKAWPEGTTEPAAWDLVGPGVDGEPSSGGVALFAHYSDVTFGNVSIRPVIDSEPPLLTNVTAAPTEDSVLIQGGTDEPAVLSIRYGETSEYEFGTIREVSYATQHTFSISQLLPNTTYYFGVTAIDGSGNASQEQQFVITTTELDLTPPVLSQLTLTMYPNLLTVTGDTDELATMEVAYGRTPTETLGFLSEATFSSQHSLDLMGLDADTTYFFRVTAADISGNESAEQILEITTPPQDLAPPVFLAVDVVPYGDYLNLTGINDEVTRWQVSYGTTPLYELGVIDSLVLSDSHAVTISGLAADTPYFVRVSATDTSGNESIVDTVATTTSLRLFASDHFSAPQLDTSIWTFVNPLGDADLTMSGNQAIITVPGGVSHQIWTDGLNAPRLMQEVSDVDFQVETKFLAAPSGSIAINGLFFEADEQNFLRFEFYSSGSSVKVYAASVSAGAAVHRINQSIPVTSGPIWLRVSRTANVWTQEYSTDGETWVTAVTFGHAVAIERGGVMVGNYGGSSAPEFANSIDYFINTASPVSDSAAPLISNLVVSPSFNHVVLSGDTDEQAQWQVLYGQTPAFELGSVTGDFGTSHVVTIPDLTADVTYYLRLIALDASANESSPLDYTVKTLLIDETQPVFLDLDSQVGIDSIRILGVNDEPVTWLVEYGLTPQHELDAVTSANYAEQHDILIDGLTAGTTYYIQVTAFDESGNSASYELVTQTDALLLPFVDGFNGPLDTSIWTFVNPLGDGSIAMTGNEAVLSIPSGVGHINENVPRLMKSIGDVDFQLESKFTSPPQGSIAIHGMRVEQDSQNYLRLEFYSSGGQVKLYAGRVIGGVLTTFKNQSITVDPNAPIWMRTTRANDTWTLEYSSNGMTWQVGAAFTSDLIVSSVGVSVGNWGGTAPAHAVGVDYFSSTV